MGLYSVNEVQMGNMLWPRHCHWCVMTVKTQYIVEWIHKALLNVSFSWLYPLWGLSLGLRAICLHIQQAGYVISSPLLSWKHKVLNFLTLRSMFSACSADIYLTYLASIRTQTQLQREGAALFHQQIKSSHCCHLSGFKPNPYQSCSLHKQLSCVFSTTQTDTHPQ